MNSFRSLPFLAGILLFIFAACAPSNQHPAGYESPALTLEDQQSGSRSLLIGVSPVSESIVWVSGTGGVVLRTTDGGSTWMTTSVPGADSLQFRDVHGVDDNTAFVLSAGAGSDSRIYKTTDGGQNWDLQFENEGPGGFFDCMDFWDPQTGIAFSDQVDGEFIILRTTNGGGNWTRVNVEAVPDATEGEGSFASSGRCVMTVGTTTGYIGTGAGTSARMLRTHDRGETWSIVETPIHGGTSTSGISSLSWLDENHGFAFGLELAGRDSVIHNAIRTRDGGATWALLTPPQLPDVYGGTHVPDRNPVMLLVVGPKGIDVSRDGGQTWSSLTKLDHWGIAFASARTGWAVGPGGRITKINLLER